VLKPEAQISVSALLVTNDFVLTGAAAGDKTGSLWDQLEHTCTRALLSIELSRHHDAASYFSKMEAEWHAWPKLRLLSSGRFSVNSYPGPGSGPGPGFLRKSPDARQGLPAGPPTGATGQSARQPARAPPRPAACRPPCAQRGRDAQ
jgi:hypothetical protein